MKGVMRDVLIALVLGTVLPSTVMNVGKVLAEQGKAGDRVAETEQTVSQEPETSAPTQGSELQMLLQQEDGQAVAMGMDAYLLGAVLAEMPADFEGEALKAQTVAARTFARRAYVTGGKHGDGAVCTNYACCQAYIAPEDYLQRGGTQEDVDWVRSCVEATSDLVLTYEGALIEATYFSCSGGRTEDAEAVWGTEYPYLQAVDSPGEENAAHYRDTVWFMPEFFAGLLGLELTGYPEDWFG